MKISWNLYLPLISCNFHKWLILQGPISKARSSKEAHKKYAPAYFPTEILLDFFNILLQYAFSSHCCLIHNSRGVWFALNVMIFVKYSSCIHLSKDDPFFCTISHQSFTINAPSKIIVMGFGLNPSPPGQRVLYSAKVKYNKRKHVSHVKNKMLTTET